MSKSTMAYRIFDDGLIICVHSSADADSASWNAYVQAIAASPLKRLRTLVFTDGGRANRDQFARLETAFGMRRTRTVVISSSVATRIFGTMVNALSKNMNAVFYPPEEVYEGLALLSVITDAEINRVLNVAAELAATVTADGHLASIGTRSSEVSGAP